ncbi:MAG TPA: DNA-formamidopyrimidine glycosylase family protein [Pyrinomonadaceae bacterium]|nr:DNA-formamidopyrimidine glycosylase family protein [Pyrinomonadaceae bacterium]
MPEGPEVRRYAAALDSVLTNQRITSIEARTKTARAWLEEHAGRLVGRRVERVVSHGKHLLGYVEGGFYFHSHLMMWGRWQTFSAHRNSNRAKSKSTSRVPESPPNTVAFQRGKFVLERDRRERARIVVPGGAAILLSAPIFNVGAGDPYQQIEILRTLGPDALPYNRRFAAGEFTRRLLLPAHRDVPIGAALLNQQIVAGLGNYLRAEILFACRLNPWRAIKDLSDRDLNCLKRAIPKVARRAYDFSSTASDRDRERMSADESLVYQPGREIGTRHMVFRRTNLPCLRCGEPVRQLRQKTFHPNATEEDDERTRIVYFCPKCQGVNRYDGLL